MENKDFALVNNYVKFVIDIYDWIFYNNFIKDIEDIKIEQKKRIFHRKKKDEFTDIVIRENAFNRAIERYKKSVTLSLEFSFGNLFDVCQFIRFSEKCLIYTNNIDQPIYVDSDLYASDEHRMHMADNDVDIYIKIKSVHDSIRDVTLSSIHVKIIHKSGKKLTNEFVIVNDNPKFNDNSDRYLFYNIKTIFEKNLSKVMDEIINNLNKIYEEKLRSIKKWYNKDY